MSQIYLTFAAIIMPIATNMDYRITPPTNLCATLRLPASKSVSNRVLLLHALSGGADLPQGLSDCDDTRVMLDALGGSPDHTAPIAGTIDIAAAGTAMRFLTAYLSTVPGDAHILTGSQRMQQRPIGVLVDALRSLGAHIDYAGAEGFPPLRITGHELQGGEVSLPGNVSSQYTSALLMIAPTMPRGLRLTLTGPIISRPYIDLTLKLMADYGARARWTSTRQIVVEPGGYRPTPYTVEADWSGASYWYEAVALMAAHLKAHPLPADPESGEPAPIPTLELRGLVAESGQGDRRGAELFARIGIRTIYTADGVRLLPMGLPVARLVEDFTDMPDLAQTFVVACCLLEIPFRFSGLQSLRIKETDRIAALIRELHKIGYALHDEGEGQLNWHGEHCPATPDPCIATYDDHRMAMAFAPAAIVVPGLRIDAPGVVTKSYPTFWDDLRTVGFHIEENR